MASEGAVQGFQPPSFWKRKINCRNKGERKDQGSSVKTHGGQSVTRQHPASIGRILVKISSRKRASAAG